MPMSARGWCSILCFLILSVGVSRSWISFLLNAGPSGRWMMSVIYDLPKLAMLSTTVRRDLQDPIRYFSQIKIVNFYRNISDDMGKAEYQHLFHYSNPVDLYQKLSSLNPQAIQGVEPFGISTIPFILTGWLYSRQANIPLIVVSLENRLLSQKYGKVAAGLMKPYLASYFQHADLIIYLNNGTYQNFLKCGAPQARMFRLMYGTWGVDTNEFSPAGQRMRIDGPGQVVLFIGRIVEEKGIYDLVDAFAMIHDQNPEIELVLIGEGRDEMRLKHRIQSLNIEGKVHLIGRVKNAQISRYLRGADLLVSPSITSRRWEEQVGMVNLQAMSCGVPVVSI